MACMGQAWAQPDSLDTELLSLDSLLNLRISSVSKYEQTTAEVPASVTIISKEDIQGFGYGSLGEVLNAVRDLYITDDRTYGYLGIRGFSRPSDFNNRVGIMVNGVLLNEDIWGQGPIESEFHGLNLDDVERVEVIRGPASSLYGNYPMLGLINIITQTGKSLDGAKVSVEHGSYGKWQASAAVGKAWRGLDVNVGARVGKTAGQNLYYREFDDSLNNFGVAEHRDDSRYWGFHGQLSYKGFSLKGFYTWRNIGVPTGAYQSIFNDPTTQVTDRWSSLELSYTHDMSAKVSVYGRTWLNSYHYLGVYPLDSASGGTQREIAYGLWGGAEGRLRWDFAANNRLMVGIEIQDHFRDKYFLGYTQSIKFDQTFHFQTIAIYLQDEWQPLKKLTLTAGGRFDRLYLGRLALTPRLAANFFAGKRTTLKALYGEAFRAPNIYEVNVGYDGYILPNYNLRPERIRSLELLCEQRFAEGFYGVLSVYRNSLRDIIEQTELSGGLLQFQNVQRAGGLGASVELNGRFQNGLHFYSSYGITRMRNLQDDEPLTNSPMHLLKGGLSIPILQHFRLSPEAVAQSGRLTVFGTKTSPFWVANVNLLFAPKFTGKAAVLNRIQLGLKVRNIFDIDYRYPGGFQHLQPSIQQNGRNYNLKLQVALF